jgi:hypothetical protein
MKTLLYQELVAWYHLIDPVADHADEAALYAAAIERGTAPVETLLELGAGAGNNAAHWRGRYRCTLTDLSEAMLGLSRAQNPGCEHIQGDMRTLRLGRTFDAVFVHDAVMYMTTEEDLAAALRTAFVHTRPGGTAVIAPDVFQEGFRDTTEILSGDDEARSLRGVEWSWAPAGGGTTFFTDYALLLREGDEVRAVHDRHVEGVFPQATWRRLLEEAGYEVELSARPLEVDWASDVVFLCRRRAR